MMAVSVGQRDPSQGMTPGQPLYNAVQAELRALIGLAERSAQPRRASMESAEKLVMNYADPTETDPETGRRLNPHERSIVVPFTAAAVETLVSYWFMGFTSRSPMIPLESRNPSYARTADYLAAVLESMHSDDMVEAKMWAWLWHACVYGRGYLHTTWYARHQVVPVPVTPAGLAGLLKGVGQPLLQTQWQLVEERQTNTNLEPRMVLADPRAPGWDPQKGEFIAYESWTSWNGLKQRELERQLFNVEEVRRRGGARDDARTNQNLSPGQFSPAPADASSAADPGYYKEYPIWARIIPAEWPTRETPIGNSYVPEIWEFALINDVVCRARPTGATEFPVYAMDSHLDVTKLFNPGDVELVMGLQQAVNFLANARLAGLRKGIYQNLVYDPAGLYDSRDITRTAPGLRLRAKLTQFPLERIVGVLPVPDLTRELIGDITNLGDMMKFATGAVDSLQGLYASGGRTATEIQNVMRSAQGRAGQRGRVMWTQGVQPWARHEIRDIQRNLSQEQYYALVGDGAKRWEKEHPEGKALIGPDAIQGPVKLAVCDVTQPVDKEHLGELWLKMSALVAQNPVLSQQFDWVGMLKEAAFLLGARNFEDFLVKGSEASGQGPGLAAQPARVVPDEEVLRGLQAGNLVPQPSGTNPLLAAIAKLAGER